MKSIDLDVEQISESLQARDEGISPPTLRQTVSLNNADVMDLHLAEQQRAPRRCSRRSSLDRSASPQRGVSRAVSTPQDLPSRRNSGGWVRPSIDIAPGYSVPLRGTEETLAAFKQDRVFQTECSNCETFLYCISTANMVLCPVCREMSPVLTDDPTNETAAESLGMGLTVEFVIENDSS